MRHPLARAVPLCAPRDPLLHPPMGVPGLLPSQRRSRRPFLRRAVGCRRPDRRDPGDRVRRISLRGREGEEAAGADVRLRIGRRCEGVNAEEEEEEDRE